MNKYISHTKKEIEEMIETIGISEEKLFLDIDENIRIENIGLDNGLSEIELTKKLNKISNKNKSINELVCFLGAGAYDHYIPSVVDSIISRQEFYTSYTPYQPEISQGNLQAIFEYQSMICELTGMEVSNASMYDGATAAAEAINVACNMNRKNEVLISSTINPDTRHVINTYGKYLNKEIREIDFYKGKTDLNKLENEILEDVGAVVVQSPNFFGMIEDIKKISGLLNKKKIYLIIIADPISLALLEPAGKLGADIVVGDGQSLGNPLSFGGPSLGFFSTNKKLMRKMPGRIVGETKDIEGKRAFVLTVQTREQHIRREKATSNICSNQALNALSASIYLSTMGKEGIKEVAFNSVQNAHYMYDRLLSINAFEEVFEGKFFKEFTLKYKGNVNKLNNNLLKNGILGGYNLVKAYDKLKDHYLVAVTEKRSKEEIDTFVDIVSEGI
jgi:glycine dehydrogenase subunit 1